MDDSQNLRSQEALTLAADAAALLLAVYGGYYLATLLSCRRMALSAAHRQREE